MGSDSEEQFLSGFSHLMLSPVLPALSFLPEDENACLRRGSWIDSKWMRFSTFAWMVMICSFNCHSGLLLHHKCLLNLEKYQDFDESQK